MNGVIYVAYGKPAQFCLKQSMESLRKHMPDLPIRVITDKPLQGVACIEAQSQDKGARSIKTRLPLYVPGEWESVIYLDVDTVILCPLTRLLEPLAKGWDAVMVTDQMTEAVGQCRLKNTKEMAYIESSYGTTELYQFAGGLMSWRTNERMAEFFRVWYEEWKRYAYRDQGALVRAVAAVSIKIWPLGWEANANPREDAKEVWHRHGMARSKGAQ